MRVQLRRGVAKEKAVMRKLWTVVTVILLSSACHSTPHLRETDPSKPLGSAGWRNGHSISSSSVRPISPCIPPLPWTRHLLCTPIAWSRGGYAKKQL
jgi:hypothetical protein